MIRYLSLVFFGAKAVFADLPSAVSPNFEFDALEMILDTDNDGMPDSWESANGLNSSLNEASSNPDGDPFTNIEEYRAGQNPQVADYPALMTGVSGVFVLRGVVPATDLDDDKLPDDWEQSFGLSTSTPNAQEDPDDDGLSNLEEFNAGSNPIVADRPEWSVLITANFLTDTGAYPAGFGTDTDHDGMPDWWESKYGLSVSVNDALGNPDGDELNNLEEYMAGRIPNVDDQFGEGFDASGNFIADTIGLRQDTDGDKMPDVWENLFGLNPNVKDGHLDPDDDGWTNLQEYNAGTNPMVDEWAGPNQVASLALTIDTGAYPLGFAFDGDNDGMPDWWEEKYFLNRTVNDAAGNPDGDTYSNVDEYRKGLHPRQTDFIFMIDEAGNLFLLDTGGEFVDSDWDGVPNWWERKYFGNPTAMSPLLDADGDGQSNGDEYEAGLHPKDPRSVFRIESIEVEEGPSGLLTIRWATQPGRMYHLYVSEALNSFPTTPVHSVVGDGTVKTRQVNRSGRTRLFCRVAVEVAR